MDIRYIAINYSAIVHLICFILDNCSFASHVFWQQLALVAHAYYATSKRNIYKPGYWLNYYSKT